MITLAEALAGLHRLEAFGVRLGLENMRAYCAAAGHPERACASLHIAGTNGKGTTAACLAALGSGSGLRTGLYTSPHVIDVRERIKVDGRPIGSRDLAEGWERIRPFVIEHGMTYFEATTLIAIEHFAAVGVELAVLEVGLGGRLDATNVVTPAAAIVTNVARDHERHLGNDLASIAREKAGIFKPGVPALVGDPGSPEVRAALCASARAAGAAIRFCREEIDLTVREVRLDATVFDVASGARRWEGLSLPPAGAHYAADAALAVWAWRAAGLGSPEPDAVRAALREVAPAGRSEWHHVDGVAYLFDVAHNPAAASCLAGAHASMGLGPAAAVIGILADKDWRAMLAALAPVTARGWLCGLETAEAGRRLARADVDRGLAGHPRIGWADTVAEGLAAARAAVAAGEAGHVVVTGSFRTVAEALLALGLASQGEPYVRAAARLEAVS